MAETIQYGLCTCSLAEHFDPVPADVIHEMDCHSQLRQPEPGTRDEWWPPSRAGYQPVNGVVLGVAHHQATFHPGGSGSGDDDYECDECDFAVEDGKVLVGGWVRWKA
jgi:hypothetical protein